jgi:riboflavin kinase / FMN adenylyltransferase
MTIEPTPAGIAFTVYGVTIRGSQSGRRLGVPTANIPVTEDVPDGVFLGWTDLRGIRRPSIIFVGVPAAGSDRQRRLETHLLDDQSPSEDLYDLQVSVAAVSMLRSVWTFAHEEELRRQIDVDLQRARAWLSEMKLT